MNTELFDSGRQDFVSCHPVMASLKLKMRKMVKNNVLVTAEKSYDSANRDAVLVKFSSEFFEVNVHIEIEQIGKFLYFLRGNTDYCLAGESAKDSVHWTREGADSVYLLIGHDLDTWDISIIIDKFTVDNIIIEIVDIYPHFGKIM